MEIFENGSFIYSCLPANEVYLLEHARWSLINTERKWESAGVSRIKTKMRSIVFGKRVPSYSNIIYRESTAVRNIFDIDIFSRLNFVANLSRQSGKRRVIRVKFKVSRHLRGKGDYSSSKKLRLDENKLFQLIFFFGFIEPIVKRSSRYFLCVSS